MSADPGLPLDSDDRRVLVVDDAATVRLYHRRVLEAAGFIVDEAANGYEALEIVLGAQPYDLVLVDVNMPQLDGYALVGRLRSAEVGLSCPVLTISTEDDGVGSERAYRAGANLYLVKPVPPARLLSLAELLAGDAP